MEGPAGRRVQFRQPIEDHAVDTTNGMNFRICECPSESSFYQMRPYTALGQFPQRQEGLSVPSNAHTAPGATQGMSPLVQAGIDNNNQPSVSSLASRYQAFENTNIPLLSTNPATSVQDGISDYLYSQPGMPPYRYPFEVVNLCEPNSQSHLQQTYWFPDSGEASRAAIWLPFNS